MIHPYDPDVDSAWYESNDARAWAATALCSPPPPLPSEERSQLERSVRNDIDTIHELCLDSFWKPDALEIKIRVTQLKRSVSQRMSILSLWRVLPPEVLGNVFLCLEDSEDRKVGKDRKRPWDHGRRLSFPTGYFVSQVCRHWRAVACRTPQCWTPLTIERREVRPILLDAWLQRTGTISLDLHLGPPLEPKAYQVLRKYIPRIRNLRITGTNKWTLDTHSEILDIINRAKWSCKLRSFELLSGESPWLPSSDVVKHLISYGFTHATRLCCMVSPWRLYSTFGPGESLARQGFLGIHGTYIRHPEHNDSFFLHDLDFTYTQPHLISPPKNAYPAEDLRYLESVSLPQNPRYVTMFKCESVLGALSNLAPQLRSIAFTGQFQFIILPPLHHVTSITIQRPGIWHRSQLQGWLDAVPQLQYLHLGETLWVESRASDDVLETTYSESEDKPFAWNKLDKAHIYAWPDTWFLCISKKGPLTSIVEHPFADCDPFLEAGRWRFPYSVDLCWSEMQKVIDAARDEAILSLQRK